LRAVTEAADDRELEGETEFASLVSYRLAGPAVDRLVDLGH
jgi:hypothetical protein